VTATVPAEPGKFLFSVVVPTYDSPQWLRRCLEGLAALKFPPDRFEVIISDDGSPSPLEPVLTPFRDRLGITLIRHPNAGPAAARNRGAAWARGSYLAFIDSDCVPAPEWLTALASRFARTPDHLIGGGVVNALPENPFSTATQLITTYVYQYYDRRPHEDRFFNSSNIAVPADRFRELGGFSESLRTAEDYDLCHRWQHAGHRMTYAPEALVYHAHVLTFAGFCRQHFRYGRGLFRCRLRIARRTRKALRLEAPGFYFQLLAFPLTRVRGSRAWLHALLVALSQAMTAAGMLREALGESWRTMSARRGADRDRAKVPQSGC
jgi:GT2 family glycosyltransferase